MGCQSILLQQLNRQNRCPFFKRTSGSETRESRAGLGGEIGPVGRPARRLGSSSRRFRVGLAVIGWGERARETRNAKELIFKLLPYA